MKVLITGAGGNLGRVLAPALADKGYEPVMMDYREMDAPFPFIKGDVTNKEDVFRAVEGVDAVVHAAALHGIHLSAYPRDDYWKLNVEGTYHVYEAAKQFNVNKILLCSTMGVYGASVKEPEAGYGIVSEELPALPGDFYGLSKKLCEELAQFYSRAHGISTIAYRLGMFVPEDFLRYGFRLLKGGVDDRDVAQSFLLGLENTTISYEAFNIMAEVPFSPDEFARWRSEPAAFLEERYPGLAGLVRAKGGNLDELLAMWVHIYWPIDRAKDMLGYRPQYNFGEFYEALRTDNEGHYPYANLPWWGI
ncbi:MAG TPA: NAD(P)-dependent oxidoreductase [Paenibacillus sp.]|uniref:NAD-dependent epimerase/dehydratase family protein n=1 Tax=Paenibacillus sp. TaxID=58172 RepID=UPI0028D2D4B6|nr:NAD(P)-dependent oxidoreductase [Paenibacillus sp.]HUC93470.1 NAD(P)-dependent oxidoreductase [Paenibacillus sp.]